MNVDIIVVGQGLCGSLLVRELQKAGRSLVIIDEDRPHTASKIASGIINPVTGRRIVKTWMIDELMPFARESYRQMELDLGIDCITPTAVIDFFPTPQMRLAFLDRYRIDAQYLSLPADENDWNIYFNYALGYGKIEPAYLIDASGLLEALRQRYSEEGLLRTERFDYDRLLVTPMGAVYNDIHAEKVIFCDGLGSLQAHWFKNLPFAPNKGEALLLEIKDLPRCNIYKKGISLVPWRDGLWWAGSSHQWQFEQEGPTEAFRALTLAQLRSFCKLPFTLIDHLAAVRPATLERRPFLGFHPAHPAIGICNGMGTKGCSLAPFFARQLADHLTKQTPLYPEVDVVRFRNVLNR